MVETLVHAAEREPPGWLDGEFKHPHQPAIPMEIRHFIRRGLKKRKEERHTDAKSVLLDLLQIRSGDVRVECPFTFLKQSNLRLENFMDSHPRLSLGLFGLGVLTLLGGMSGWVMLALG